MQWFSRPPRYDRFDTPPRVCRNARARRQRDYTTRRHAYQAPAMRLRMHWGDQKRAAEAAQNFRGSFTALVTGATRRRTIIVWSADTAGMSRRVRACRWCSRRRGRRVKRGRRSRGARRRSRLWRMALFEQAAAVGVGAVDGAGGVEGVRRAAARAPQARAAVRAFGAGEHI